MIDIQICDACDDCGMCPIKAQCDADYGDNTITYDADLDMYFGADGYSIG